MIWLASVVAFLMAPISVLVAIQWLACRVWGRNGLAVATAVEGFLAAAVVGLSLSALADYDPHYDSRDQLGRAATEILLWWAVVAAAMSGVAYWVLRRRLGQNRVGADQPRSE